MKVKKIECCSAMSELSVWDDYMIYEQKDIDDPDRDDHWYLNKLDKPGFYFKACDEGELVLSREPIIYCPWCATKIDIS